MDNYDLIYGAQFLNDTAINYLNKSRKENPNAKIVIEISNTRFLSSKQLRKLDSTISIRIAGGYTKERVQARKDTTFKNGETGEYYTSAVIYSVNETIKIIEAMEKIEKGIKSDWNDLQKIIYIYEKLKSGIKYDPKYEFKHSYDIRTLRGFITKQTVCAGYAIMFKEILDRQGISCDYIEGKSLTGGHAWNIVEVDGKKYPIDLTWDSSAHRRGDFKSLKYFGQNNEEFRRNHIPDSFEPIQDYESELSSFDLKTLEIMRREANRDRDYNSTTFIINRKNATKCMISQVGNSTINGVEFFRYLYTEKDEKGNTLAPLILYSETNVAAFVEAKTYLDKETFERVVPEHYGQAIDSILFSRENILDSLKRKTLYLGKISKKENGEIKVVKSVKEIEKNEENMKLFSQPHKRFTRSDGTSFIIIQLLLQPKDGIMHYECFELVEENGKTYVRKNALCSNQNLLKIDNQELIDTFLSRERIERKCNESGGYLGSYSTDKKKHEDVKIIEYEEQKTPMTHHKLKPFIKFEELHQLSNKYEIYIDPKDQVDFKPEYIKIKNIETGEIEQNPDIVENAIFANIWLGSAGVKWMYGEKRDGETYAFNDGAENIYKYMCSKLSEDIVKTGTIDTVDLYLQSDALKYSHAEQTIANLFGTQYQTQFLEQYFKNRVATKVQSNTHAEPLYNMQYVFSTLIPNTNQEHTK